MDTTWFDVKFKKTTKSNATFYRVFKKADDKFFVFDRFTTGEMQMYAEAKQLDPLVKNGYAVYYNEDGSKQARGNYNNNIKIGLWVKYFENEKDSSVYTLNDNGTVNYIRRSELQKEEIYTTVEKQAKYPGGIPAISVYIQKNLIYPPMCEKSRIGGKAIVKFIIDLDGKVIDPVIVKSSGSNELDKEAIRVTSLMPLWEPATINDRKVKCYFNMPISFNLHEPYFVINNFNRNKNYSELSKAIIENDLNDIWNKIKDVGNSENDSDYLFLKGVLYYNNSKNKKEACKMFEKVVANADGNSDAYNLSKTFIQKYCN